MNQYAMIKGNDSWLRVSHDNTTLDQTIAAVQLAWQIPEPAAGTANANTDDVMAGGLAVDPWCRIYKVSAANKQVLSYLWENRLQVDQRRPLFNQQSEQPGDFDFVDDHPGGITPGPIAVSSLGHLFIVDKAANSVIEMDLVERRKRRTIKVKHKIVALVARAYDLFLLVMDEVEKQLRLMVATPHGVSEYVDALFPELEHYSEQNALTIAPDSRIFGLFNANTSDAFIWAFDGNNAPIPVPYASSVVFSAPHELVVARNPGADFLRFFVQKDNHAAMPHLNAGLYDGGGITLGPSGQVVYWSKKGLLSATQAKVNFLSKGRIVCFRLDNQRLQQRWGRVFIDACLPQGTKVKLGFIVADELNEGPSHPLNPPANMGEFDLLRPDLSPPMPAQHAFSQLDVAYPVHRRSQNRELPWSFGEEPWRTYEAPVHAPPGRFLWLVIDLYGKSHSTPKIRDIRVEYPDRDLLRHLPRLFSQPGEGSEFLQRYLSLLHSNFDELDKRAAEREVLLDPAATPAAALPWLSSLIGMDLDWRWSEEAKREVIEQAMWLFKYRGTVTGIKRFIEIYLQREINLVEHFKTRGLGGAFVGESEYLSSSAILGAGFRIGGKLDTKDTLLLDEEQQPVSLTDAITEHAHKFTVVVPVILSKEQRDVIEHILNVHRPAHTLFELCDIGSGMRLGTGLHLGLTSVVGQSSGFGELQVGNSVLGRTDVLGKPVTGISLSQARVSQDARLG